MEMPPELMAEMYELRFSSPVWKFWAQRIWLSLLSVGFLVIGLLTLGINLWGGVVMVAMGTVFVLPNVFRFISQAKTAMWQWGQLYPPEVLIDAVGVHYLGARSVDVPWPDIERIFLTFSTASGGRVSLRLKPDTPLLRGDMIKTFGPYLNVGLLSQTGLMDVVAMDILTETAGPLLKINELDRRHARHAR